MFNQKLAPVMAVVRILYLFVLCTLYAEACDIIGLNLCTWKLAQNVTGSRDFTVLPSRTQIEKLCTFRDDFKNCYKPKLKKCSDTLLYVSTFATTKKTVDFICKAGYFDMVSNDECWKKPDVQNMSNACYKNHVENVKIQLQQISMTDEVFTDEVKKSWCRILLDSYECMHESVTNVCVQSSVDVVTDMMNTVFADLYSVMECQTPDRWTYRKDIEHYWEPDVGINLSSSLQTGSYLLLILTMKITVLFFTK